MTAAHAKQPPPPHQWARMARAVRIALLALAALAVALYVLAIRRFAADMPITDDYLAILAFLMDFSGQDLPARFASLLAQYNEHRLLIPRLIAWAAYAAAGQVQFVHLIWIGNLAWLCTGLLFWRQARRAGVTPAQFTPIVILMATFSHHDLMTWAMASIQQYYQLLLGFVAITFMVAGQLRAALAFLVLSCCTGGGGLVLVPLMLLYHLARREWGKLMVSLAVSAMVVLIYFPVLDYQHPVGHPSIAQALMRPAELFLYACAFLGGIAHNTRASVALGLLLLLLFIRQAPVIFRSNPWVAWSAVFILGSALVNAMARSGFGLHYATSSRYTEYSLLFIGLVYLSYLGTAGSKRQALRVHGVGAVLALGVFALWLQPGMQGMEQRLLRLQHGDALVDRPDLTHLLARARELGIFRAPRDFVSQ